MKLKLNQNVSTRGYYKLFVKDSSGNIKSKSFLDPINNVVTNLGREQWLSSDSFSVDNVAEFNSGSFYIGVGDGTVERSQSSGDLGNELFSRQVITQGPATGYTDNGDGTQTFSKVYVASYDIGAVTGTISEVGVFNSISLANRLIAGQLIKDGTGSPTTLTIQSDEQLVIEYTIEWTYSVGSQTGPSGSIIIKGTSYNYTVELSGIRKNLTGFWAVPQTSFASFPCDNFVFRDSANNILGGFEHTENRTVTQGSSYEFNFTGTLSPSEFTSSDIKSIYVASEPNSSLSYDSVDDDRGPLAIITFDTPFEKTSSEAIQLDITVTVTVT